MAQAIQRYHGKTVVHAPPQKKTVPLGMYEQKSENQGILYKNNFQDQC